MILHPRIVHLEEKKCIGISMQMSLVDNNTQLLWRTFMPRRREILNPISADVICAQVYSEDYFKIFNPHTEFTKWALVLVEDFNVIPQGMESLVLSEGSYAVFDYKGHPDDNSIFQNIYSSWLPNSGFALDNLPHFEILGDNFKLNNSKSEEEIWIPVKQRR